MWAMKDEELGNMELVALFKARFVDAKTAASIIGFERVSSINTLVHRDILTRYHIAPRFAVYEREAVEEYARTRPGKGGRPKKSE